MHLFDDVLLELAEVATIAARAAGKLISDHQDKPINIALKESGKHLASQIVTEVDQKSEALILDYLQPCVERYDLAVLCEESEDSRLRLVRDYFWCIDPLDGTLAYTESKPGYAVSIALVSREGEALIGVVFDPVTETLYSAVKGHGVLHNGRAVKKHTENNATKFVLPCDRSFAERSEYSIFIELLEQWVSSEGYSGLELVREGGAVMNACKVLESSSSCYFKLPKDTQGGGSLWDVAATACLFSEIGAFATDYHGQKLNLNNDSTFMNTHGVFFSHDNKVMNKVKALLVRAMDCSV